MKKSYRFEIWPVALVDLLLMYAGVWISIAVRYHGTIPPAEVADHYRLFTPIFIAWLVVFFSYSLFEASAVRRYVGLVTRLVSAMAVNALIAVAFFYVQPSLILTPRRFLLLDVGVTFALLLAWYLALKFFLRSRYVEDIYIFADGPGAAAVAREIQAHAFLGLRFAGKLDRAGLLEKTFSTNHQTSVVIMSDAIRADAALGSAMLDLRRLGVNFYNHREFYETLLRRVDLASLDELWFVEHVDYQHKALYQAFDRLVDIVAGAALLCLFLVTYPFVAVAVKCSSPGPVLVEQQRVGQFGKPFTLYKYRSMVTATGTTWTERNDPRITRVGKFLRATRLDEVPQAVNLILGSVSLVGPRPEQVGIAQDLALKIPFYGERHLAKPGLTGWAQLHSYAGSLEEAKLKLEYDLYYVRHRSPLFDLEIILKTIYYMFTLSGR